MCTRVKSADWGHPLLCNYCYLKMNMVQAQGSKRLSGNPSAHVWIQHHRQLSPLRLLQNFSTTPLAASPLERWQRERREGEGDWNWGKTPIIWWRQKVSVGMRKMPRIQLNNSFLPMSFSIRIKVQVLYWNLTHFSGLGGETQGMARPCGRWWPHNLGFQGSVPFVTAALWESRITAVATWRREGSK